MFRPKKTVLHLLAVLVQKSSAKLNDACVVSFVLLENASDNFHDFWHRILGKDVLLDITAKCGR